MALFQYTEAQQGVQTQPFQVASQPNMAAANAFTSIQEGLLKALQGATLVKQDISENNYREAKLKLQEDVSYMNTRLADADFETQKKLVEEFQTKTNQYSNPKNKYEQSLYADYQAQFGNYAAKLIEYGVQDQYTTNLLNQNTAILQYGQEFNDLSSYEERETKLAEYDAKFIAPYQGFNDKYSKDLLAKAIATKDKFNTALTTERVAIKDNTVTGNAFDLIATNMQIDGVLTPETYELAVDELAKRSDWDKNSTALRQQLADKAIYAIVNNNATKPQTRENALEFEKQLNDFAKVDPRVKNTDTFKAAQNSLLGFNKAIDYNEVNSLALKVTTDTYPISEIKNDAAALKNRGVITDVQEEAYIFKAEEGRKVKNVKDQVTNAYVSQDLDTLVALQNNGNGATVRTVATANITNELAVNSRQMPMEQAFAITFKKIKEFNDKGIYVGNIEPIEQILDYPTTGKLQSEEDVAVYLATVKQARENGYASKSLTKNSGDALVLSTWSKLGVPDIVQKYQAFKLNPKAASDKEALVIYNNLVDNEFSFRNLQGTNDLQLKNVLLPAIKAGLKAGLSASDISGWENLLEDQYYDAGSYIGLNKRIMLPKDSPIANKNIYEQVIKHYPDAVVVPKDILDGNGEWIIQTPEGAVSVSADYLFKKAKTPVITKGK